MNHWIKNGLGVAGVAAVAIGTGWAVRHYHTPGQLDVISAQAMDMSRMRPPTGAAPVALASARRGLLADAVTYTGSVLAYNEQDISPRITGMLLSLPVYPGDSVRAGQVVARLDTGEVGAKADQAAQEARQARFGAEVAHLTHRLHHGAALDQATAQVGAARQRVADAEAGAQTAEDAVADAQAGVEGAQAGADYWKTEIVREKQLVDAGAASRQEYQGELAQAQSAQAALAQARSKVGQARATAQGARAKVGGVRQEVAAARAGVRVAQADIAVAEGQATQAEAGASAAAAAARVAAVQQGYSRIVSPAGGVVTARPVAPGTLVQPGTVILKVAEIDRVRVQANVAAADLPGIRVGSPVAFTVQGGGAEQIRARVTSVFPGAASQTRTAVVEAIVPNPAHRLLPGGFVTMRITRNVVGDALLVPAAALVSQGGRSSVWAAANEGPSAGATAYECAVCHMRYSAADAKKNNYKDPMDGGRLLPVTGGHATTATGLTAHRVPVRVGASDGLWTEVASDALSAGARVVTRGQAGLADGVPLVVTPWDADGPTSLPTAATASGSGQTRYRCEKCGMTYSAADAKKNNYKDPMDGGRLSPVRGG